MAVRGAAEPNTCNPDWAGYNAGMLPPRTGAGLAVLLVAMALPVAAASASPLPGAEYRGKGTALAITDAGNAVTISELPVRQPCKGRTPTNARDYGDPGLGPFTIEADGSFSNGGETSKIKGTPIIKGRFRAKKVTGTIKEFAFKDSAKGFDCSKWSGAFSAKLVKGTGQRPGAVLATDDFSDPTSGFEVYNETDIYAEYLPDARFRAGVRAPASAIALRAEPGDLASVEVEADTLTFGSEPTSSVGLVCQAIPAARDFTVGFVNSDSTAQIYRYQGGEIVQESTAGTLAAGVWKTGTGAKNTLDLVCRVMSGGGTEVVLEVNGSEAASMTSASARPGQTGVMVSGSSVATEYNFTRFEVRVPKSA